MKSFLVIVCAATLLVGCAKKSSTMHDAEPASARGRVQPAPRRGGGACPAWNPSWLLTWGSGRRRRKPQKKQPMNEAARTSK